MKRIENAKEMVNYLKSWDYAETYYSDEVIEAYAIACELEENGEKWDFDSDNIPDSYLDLESISYEDTNGLDDLRDDIREPFDADIDSFCTAIVNNEADVNNMLKSKFNADNFWEAIGKPGENYVSEILDELTKVISNS